MKIKTRGQNNELPDKIMINTHPQRWGKDRCRRSEVRGQERTEVGGQMSEIRGRKSEIRKRQRTDNGDGCPDEMRFTVTMVNFMG